ncbi:MAG: trypsin-like peptidase domain-containing protein [Neobacillus sp.]
MSFKGDIENNKPLNQEGTDIKESMEETLFDQTAVEMSATEESMISNRIDLKKSNKKRNLKALFSAVAAGVVGSVLTLTILPHTDYIQNFTPERESQAIISNQSGASSEVKAVPTSAVTNSSSIADTVEQLSKTIVGVVNYQQLQGRSIYGNSSSQSVQSGTGSGVIFQKNKDIAYIVTNNHVVEGASKLEISLYNGEKVEGEIVGTDALTDLAVLKIDAKYVDATAEFGDSSSLRPGDQVYAIGNPLGLDLSRTVTQGIVSAINRSIAIETSAGNWETNVIQTDAAINPGNSGGALINPQGLVIGINSLKISNSGVEGLGFAIPSNDLIPIVNELINNGKIERPYLGVGLADLEQIPQLYWPKNVSEGVIITTVEPNSAAANAGLQVKDVIVSINDTKIKTASELRRFLYTKVKVGEEVKVEVYRDGEAKTVTVNLTK